MMTMIMDDGGDEEGQQASSSSSSTFLQQLVAQRTAFVQVKQEELTDDDLATANTNTNDDYHDPDGHLCVVCMDNERSCLHVLCNHLAVCVECERTSWRLFCCAHDVQEQSVVVVGLVMSWVVAWALFVWFVFPGL